MAHSVSLHSSGHGGESRIVLAVLLTFFILYSNVSRADDDHWWSGFGDQGVNGFVYAQTVFQNELVAGGFFDQAGGVPMAHIARWDGNTWHALGSGIDGTGVFCLTVYKGALIAGGYFSHAGGVPTSNIARWDGTHWTPLGTGCDNLVWCLSVYGEDLVAGGIFLTAGGQTVNYIARWDGGAWSPLGGGMTGEQGFAVGVLTLGELGTDLVAGGSFLLAGTTVANNVARWDGSRWWALNSGTNGIAYAQSIYDGALVVGGSFNRAGGRAVARIARWDGTSWSALGGGVSGGSNAVDALTILDGRLIVGGVFTEADGIPANRIAVWDGSSWGALGSGANEAVRSLQVLDNHLYVGGSFTTAGGKASLHMARWDPLLPTGIPEDTPEGGPGNCPPGGCGGCIPAGPLTSTGLHFESVYPNPFAGDTHFAYSLRTPGAVRLDVFDALGRRVATVVDGRAEPGLHTDLWNGRDTSGRPVSPGAYLARLRSDGEEIRIKLMRTR